MGKSIGSRSQRPQRALRAEPLLPRSCIPADFESFDLDPVSPLQRELTILLLEDHVDTANAMDRLLRSFGHKVETVLTTADALVLANARAFDLIISDIELGDMSGRDFIRAIREFSKIPAIALTGFGSEEDVVRSLQAGLNGHLTKPVDTETLRASISEAVA